MATGAALHPVALLKVPDYGEEAVFGAVGRLFEAIRFRPPAGAEVLVKPNLISARSHGLACTHPMVVRAACRALLDHGCRVRVGDSPAFGSASFVARRSGYTAALKGLGVPLVTLGRPMDLDLSFGQRIGVSGDALESDIIVNLPKLKCHGQMGITLGVKNLFGCVVGLRKGFAHRRFGGQENRFEAMIVDVMQALPQAVTLIDGILAMHVTGPMGGKPYALQLLGACQGPVPLDTALCAMLGIVPDLAPVWRECRARDLPGSRAEDIAFPLLAPEDFNSSGFRTVERLDNVSFRPFRFVKSTLKRIFLRMRH